MTDFLPVLLGSDANVYGMARSFYGQYGVTSAAVCKGALVATANSKLVKIAVLEPRLEEDEVFVRTLIDFARRQTRPLVLVSCADGYTILLARHREELAPYYHFACPDLQTVLDLDIKDNFYRACAAHGLSYPKTATCTTRRLTGTAASPTRKRSFWPKTGRSLTRSPRPSTAAATRTS